MPSRQLHNPVVQTIQNIPDTVQVPIGASAAIWAFFADGGLQEFLAVVAALLTIGVLAVRLALNIREWRQGRR